MLGPDDKSVPRGTIFATSILVNLELRGSRPVGRKEDYRTNPSHMASLSYIRLDRWKQRGRTNRIEMGPSKGVGPPHPCTILEMAVSCVKNI